MKETWQSPSECCDHAAAFGPWTVAGPQHSNAPPAQFKFQVEIASFTQMVALSFPGIGDTREVETPGITFRGHSATIPRVARYCGAMVITRITVL